MPRLERLMTNQELSLKEAQRIVLTSQRLVGKTPSPQEIIEHLGYVQIDTISVVERAHHHVFWSRNSKYRPTDLDRLVSSRKVYEHWSHAASYLPMKDYRFSQPLKQEFAKRSANWFPRDKKMMREVLNRIKSEGPLRSVDFKNSKKTKSSGWWDWKPAKKASERLFLEGELEISRREGFQKVYDLPERVIPSFVETKSPTKREYYRYLIMRAVRHNGLATPEEVGYLKSKKVKDEIAKEMKEMHLAQELDIVTVKGVEGKFYVDTNCLGAVGRWTPKIKILSPFDNFIIQRKRLSRLFGFDYQIECYVPAPKRKFGYFSLPIFYGSKPIGRVDCKADRSEETLIVQSMHFEKGVDKREWSQKLEAQLKSFAKFNGCKQVVH